MAAPVKYRTFRTLHQYAQHPKRMALLEAADPYDMRSSDKLLDTHLNARYDFATADPQRHEAVKAMCKTLPTTASLMKKAHAQYCQFQQQADEREKEHQAALDAEHLRYAELEQRFAEATAKATSERKHREDELRNVQQRLRDAASDKRIALDDDAALVNQLGTFIQRTSATSIASERETQLTAEYNKTWQSCVNLIKESSKKHGLSVYDGGNIETHLATFVREMELVCRAKQDSDSLQHRLSDTVTAAYTIYAHKDFLPSLTLENKLEIFFSSMPELIAAGRSAAERDMIGTMQQFWGAIKWAPDAVAPADQAREFAQHICGHVIFLDNRDLRLRSSLLQKIAKLSLAAGGSDRMTSYQLLENLGAGYYEKLQRVELEWEDAERRLAMSDSQLDQITLAVEMPTSLSDLEYNMSGSEGDRTESYINALRNRIWLLQHAAASVQEKVKDMATQAKLTGLPEPSDADYVVECLNKATSSFISASGTEHGHEENLEMMKWSLIDGAVALDANFRFQFDMTVSERLEAYTSMAKGKVLALKSERDNLDRALVKGLEQLNIVPNLNSRLTVKFNDFLSTAVKKVDEYGKSIDDAEEVLKKHPVSGLAARDSIAVKLTTILAKKEDTITRNAELQKKLRSQLAEACKDSPVDPRKFAELDELLRELLLSVKSRADRVKADRTNTAKRHKEEVTKVEQGFQEELREAETRFEELVKLLADDVDKLFAFAGNAPNPEPKPSNDANLSQITKWVGGIAIRAKTKMQLIRETGDANVVTIMEAVHAMFVSIFATAVEQVPNIVLPSTTSVDDVKTWISDQESLFHTLHSSTSIKVGTAQKTLESQMNDTIACAQQFVGDVFTLADIRQSSNSGVTLQSNNAGPFFRDRLQQYEQSLKAKKEARTREFSAIVKKANGDLVSSVHAVNMLNPAYTGTVEQKRQDPTSMEPAELRRLVYMYCLEICACSTKAAKTLRDFEAFFATISDLYEKMVKDHGLRALTSAPLTVDNLQVSGMHFEHLIGELRLAIKELKTENTHTQNRLEQTSRDMAVVYTIARDSMRNVRHTMHLDTALLPAEDEGALHEVVSWFNQQSDGAMRSLQRTDNDRKEQTAMLLKNVEGFATAVFDYTGAKTDAFEQLTAANHQTWLEARATDLKKHVEYQQKEAQRATERLVQHTNNTISTCCHVVANGRNADVGQLTSDTPQVELELRTQRLRAWLYARKDEADRVQTDLRAKEDTRQAEFYCDQLRRLCSVFSKLAKQHQKLLLDTDLLTRFKPSKEVSEQAAGENFTNMKAWLQSTFDLLDRLVDRQKWRYREARNMGRLSQEGEAYALYLANGLQNRMDDMEAMVEYSTENAQEMLRLAEAVM